MYRMPEDGNKTIPSDVGFTGTNEEQVIAMRSTGPTPPLIEIPSKTGLGRLIPMLQHRSQLKKHQDR